jgi:hypothetical protein
LTTSVTCSGPGFDQALEIAEALLTTVEFLFGDARVSRAQTVIRDPARRGLL